MNHAIHFTLTLALSPELTAIANRLIDVLGGGGMTEAEAAAVTAKLQEQAARLEGIAGDAPPASP